ncbi:hypothetical protein FSP39_011871 [Pinctada imbricata]|uniref:Fibrinogen C-terminal domain-containing protein n=1 Tax=Pinctada imbricata TaxID=66713 RepID=A0AA88YVA2_PINIB|nr:hypothetical protein FSP39_011871 [Pinctada imbricata]
MCIRECVKRNCKSVNFNKEKLQCDLMSTNDGCPQNGDIFQADPDYIFVNVSDSENIEKIFQRRMNGLTDFYRNWEDYKYGFGNPIDESWLGNMYLYQLTKNRCCQLRIELVNWDNIAGYALYENFSITDENDGYRLRIGTYSGNAGQDSLKYHNGMKFTTLDRDNDNRSLNCAVKWKGAWWYNSCHHSHLNGDYSIRTDSAGLGWNGYPSSDYMKETTMKLKCG